MSSLKSNIQPQQTKKVTDKFKEGRPSITNEFLQESGSKRTFNSRNYTKEAKFDNHFPNTAKNEAEHNNQQSPLLKKKYQSDPNKIGITKEHLDFLLLIEEEYMNKHNFDKKRIQKPVAKKTSNDRSRSKNSGKGSSSKTGVNEVKRGILHEYFRKKDTIALSPKKIHKETPPDLENSRMLPKIDQSLSSKQKIPTKTDEKRISILKQEKKEKPQLINMATIQESNKDYREDRKNDSKDTTNFFMVAKKKIQINDDRMSKQAFIDNRTVSQASSNKITSTQMSKRKIGNLSSVGSSIKKIDKGVRQPNNGNTEEQSQ